MICKTDYNINGIYIAKGLLSSLTKYYANIMINIENIIRENKLLKLPNGIGYRIGCSRKDVHGLYYHEYNIIEVNPKQTRCDFISSVLHELIHAEQAATGKYKIKIEKNGIVKAWWKGTKIGEGLAMIPWRERPWEQEAINKTKDLLGPLYKGLIERGII